MNRAVGRGEHPLFGKTAKSQLLKVGRNNVQVGFASSFESFKQLLPIAELFLVALDYIVTYFIALHTRGRPQRRQTISRVDPVVQHQIRYRSLHDSSGGTSPACVYRCDRSARWIGDQHRQTIRSLNSEQDSSELCDQSVALAVLVKLIRRVDVCSVRGM